MLSAMEETTDLAGLRKQLADAEDRASAVAQELQEIFSTISPYATDHAPSTPLERLRMQERRPALQREQIEAEAIVEDLRSKVALIEAAEKARLRTEFFERKKPLVRRLAKALDVAAEANALLAKVEDDEASAVGLCDRGAWWELGPESAQLEPHLVAWRRWAQQSGLLD